MRRSFLVVPLALALAISALAAASAGAQQRRVIRGRVYDAADNRPIPGAQVVILGTKTGVLGGPDGTFVLPAPAGALRLQVTYIGYKSTSVAVAAGAASVDVPMTLDALKLDELVVTGQATGISRRNLANAVSKVDASDLQHTPTEAIEQSLQGKVAGATITENNGAPGGGSIVRMRGTTSIIGAFTPLYVVDGVIVSDVSIPSGTNTISHAFSSAGIASDQDNADNRIADLNPDDIASVEVLKGAAAAAIYGSKAANGVILITTKRGAVGRPRFTLSQKMGTSEILQKFGERHFASLADAQAVFGDLATQYYKPGVFFDNESQLYQKPFNWETDASMSGGTENTQYYASLLAKQDGGTIRNTFADKYSLHVALDQRVGDHVKLGFATQVIRNSNDRGLTQNENNGTTLLAGIVYTPSFFDLRQRADGTWPVNPFTNANPIQTDAMFQNREGVWRGITSGKADIDVIQNDRQTLKFNWTGGLDLFTQKNNVFSPPELQFEQDGSLPGTSILSFSQNLNITSNENLVHTYQGGWFSTTTSLGMQLETIDLDIDRTLSQNLIGGQQNINNGTKVSVEENRQRVKDHGFFAQEEFLTFNQRLLLTLGGRADRSSNNGDPNHYFLYPKSAVSFRFPSPVRGLDELKLRAAAGESGNEPLYGQKFTELTGANMAGIPVYRIAGLVGAPDLRPERQREIEGGFDLTMFNSKATLGVTGYEKRITDMLLTRTLAPSSGMTTEYFNGGVMRNRGLELELNSFPVQRKDLTWNLHGNFSLNRCLIESLPVPAFRPNAFLNSNVFGSTFIEPGKSCTQLVGYDTTKAGDRVVDQIGDAAPSYRFGIGNNLTYHRLSLYLLVDRSKGGNLLDASQLVADLSGTSPDYDKPARPGAPTGAQRGAWVGRYTKGYMYDISFWKIREATLSLDLPPSLMQRLWGQTRSVRLQLSGHNLYTWTPYPTGDPEVQQEANSLAYSVPWDLWAYPSSRSVWLSVDVGF